MFVPFVLGRGGYTAPRRVCSVTRYGPRTSCQRKGLIVKTNNGLLNFQRMVETCSFPIRRAIVEDYDPWVFIRNKQHVASSWAVSWNRVVSVRGRGTRKQDTHENNGDRAIVSLLARCKPAIQLNDGARWATPVARAIYHP